MTNQMNKAPEKYVVFMTDGENTSYNGKTSPRNQEKADSVTKAACTTAKNNGIAVFTVAVMAPQRGKDLLKACATSLDHYKEADERRSFRNSRRSAKKLPR